MDGLRHAGTGWPIEATREWDIPRRSPRPSLRSASFWVVPPDRENDVQHQTYSIKWVAPVARRVPLAACS
ncbi:MAG: hypothetical protein ACF8TS_14710, partial [Maioricimonas sp. JB049]